MDKGLRTIKPFSRYFREAIRFYDLDKPFVAQIIFILSLAVQFGGYMMAKPYVIDLYTHYEKLYVRLEGELSLDKINSIMFASGDYEVMIQSFIHVVLLVAAIRFATFLISLFFGSWFLWPDQSRDVRYQRTLVFFKATKTHYFQRALQCRLLFWCPCTDNGFGHRFVNHTPWTIFTALIPLFVMALSTLFVFKDLLIIEFGCGDFQNFKRALTYLGNKKQIIMNMMSLYILGWLEHVFHRREQCPPGPVHLGVWKASS